jgi:protein involved in polysaccharide export with SLBB domain
VAAAAPAAAEVVAFRPASTTCQRRAVCCALGRPTTREPALAGAPAQPGCTAGCPAAPTVVLRPVPSAEPPSGIVTSSWNGAPAAPEGAPAVLGVPVATSVVQAQAPGPPPAPELAPMPTPISSSAVFQDEKEKAKGKEKEADLPVPRRSQGLLVPAPHRAPFDTHPPYAPREFAKRAISDYIIEAPDILLIQATAAITLPGLEIRGGHLVRPDGTVSLGAYGKVFVNGRTIEEARHEIARVLQGRVKKREPGEIGKDGRIIPGKVIGEYKVEEIESELQVDVVAYNSKFYYIIADNAGYGQQVYRIAFTGNETVLDGISQIQGLPAASSKKRVWVARATPDHQGPHILPVDWCGITKRGEAGTNYQIFPGDRIFVGSDPWLWGETWISKRLNVVDRVLSTLLLFGSTKNQLK